MQPYEGTASAGFFADSALQLVQRLAGHSSTEASELSASASRLAVLFREWTTRRPPDEERVAKIRELFEHNRRVLDYLAKAGVGVKSSPIAARVGSKR